MDKDIISALIGAGGGLVGALLGAWIAHSSSMRQIRATQRAELKNKVMEEKLKSYKKFLALLQPISDHVEESRRVILVQGDRAYINKNAFEALFKSVNDFIFSEDGAGLSWKLVQEVVPTARTFIEEAIKESEPQENNLIAISNSKKKDAQRGLNWIRQKALEESGLRDAGELNQELG